MPDKLKIFTGNSNPKLAQDICAALGVPLGQAQVAQFEDGETMVRINENIRGEDIFVIQPTQSPAVNLMELLILVDACKRASARRVTAVVPYFGYARQDRKDQPRVSITAKLVSNLITVAGADRVLTMDLHSSQIQCFFDIPFDHLFAAPVLIEEYKTRKLPNLTVVAPDIGSVKMARAYAKRLGADLALVDKRRPKADSVEVMNIIGEVKDRTVVMFDDMVTTASTLIEAARALREAGARDIFAGITHAVLCGDSKERIARSTIREVVVTDTVPHDPATIPGKIKVRSVAPLLAEAVKRIHTEESLSSLFIDSRAGAPGEILESPEH
ncbi:MAG: ribose-phosphate pyrophosphokinase [Candidatus Eisenbacteria bacterium]|nr:ribose-phosphate pyrophosphokinase [Candidatus Eisenbacteria bacterium]